MLLLADTRAATGRDSNDQEEAVEAEIVRLESALTGVKCKMAITKSNNNARRSSLRRRLPAIWRPSPSSEKRLKREEAASEQERAGNRSQSQLEIINKLIRHLVFTKLMGV